MTNKSSRTLRNQVPQEFYRLLAEEAADGIFTVDLLGRLTYANSALEKITGIPFHLAKDKNFTKYVFKDSLKAAERCFQSAKKGNAGVSEEISIIGQNKNLIPVEVHASPIHKGGKIIGVEGIVRDVRKRKELENLLHESERKYRDLFEDATDALVIADLNGIILDANHHAEILFKKEKMRLVGMHQSQLYAPEHEEAYHALFRRSLQAESEAEDLEIVRSDGQAIPVSVCVRRITTNAKEVVLIRLTDLSQRIRNEEKVRETNKMMALSLFVSGTAQEIKHPLRAVLNHIQQLMNKYQNRDFEYIGFKEFSDIMNTMRSVSNQVRYCCDITDKLLLLSRKRAGMKEGGCDIDSVIRESTKLLSPQFKLANVKVALRLATKLPLVAIDSVDFDQIIINVISNALQAMPDGGQFAVKTSYSRTESNVCIEFQDNGIGIPKENLPHVFDPFFTTKQVGPNKNSGLGLSIVYSIVKSCKGEVSIVSSLRRGTTVKVVLPVSKKKK